jgi:translation initiation factor 2 subunit 1
MKWYKDIPDEGDFVVITLTDIDQNSAYAELDEYEDLSGLIHISEVSRSWVQDINKELSEGEKTVAQVVEAEDENNISLSIKRVNDKQKREAMSRWNKEQKAEEFIEEVAEELSMDLEEAIEEIAFPMQEEFGSSFHGFEISVGKEDQLEDLFDEEVVDAIQKVAENNIDLKKEKLEGEVELNFYQGNGLERIQEALVNDMDGVEIKYVSAPNYAITTWGRTKELAKEKMDKTIEQVREKTQELDGKFEFSRA